METVAEVLNDANVKLGKSFDTLKQQFAGLRTGKASPAMVDQIKVDYYGCPTPIKNLGTISTPEPRQIKITPFDPTVLDAMNKAILAANIGVTPQTDGKVLRINVPELNEERRKEIVKVAKTQAEAQKVAMRNVRRDANDAVKKLEKDKKISEDDMKQGLDKIQKATLTISLRRSSLSSGTVMRRTLPSVWGVTPMLAARIALFIASSTVGSNGAILIWRGSGVEIVPRFLIGVGQP